MSGYRSGMDDVHVDADGDCNHDGCTWTGTVDAVIDTRFQTLLWTCPKCGTDYEEGLP